MEALNPVEKLQLVSITNKDYFNTKNKLYCLLYQLNIKERLIFKDNKFKLRDFDSDELNIVYEEEFLRLLKSKRYFDLIKFLDEIHFIPTLVRYGLIREHLQKSRFGMFNKKVIEKTDEYYKIYNKMIEGTNNKPLVEVVCDYPKENKNIRLLVDKIVLKFKQVENS